MTRILSRLTLALLMSAPFASTAVYAGETVTCADRAQVVARLKQRFQEQSLGEHRAASGDHIEIFAAPGFKTWTVTTQVGNNICLLSTGKGRQSLKMARL
jgi:hypothetical protein